MVQVKYTQKDIYERVFKPRRIGVGYDPQDVDDFLDGVISDYGIFNDRIEQLQGEVSKLQGALRAAQEQLVAYQEKNVAARSDVETDDKESQEMVSEKPATHSSRSVVEEAGTTKSDIKTVNTVDKELLARVANLELAVFGHERGNEPSGKKTSKTNNGRNNNKKNNGTRNNNRSNNANNNRRQHNRYSGNDNNKK